MKVKDENNIPKIREELAKLGKYNLEVGVFGKDDSFITMLATVHEFGVTIYPKNSKYLAVPNGKGGIVKLKSVTIPERSFIRSTFDEREPTWNEYAVSLIGKIIRRTMTAEELLERLGTRMSTDIKKTMQELDTPPNAPLTVANKGVDNPLIGTGKLRQSVTWKVVPV